MNIQQNKSAKVLIVGDVMLDRYLHGDSQRISPEAPVPIINLHREEYRPGGAANVAINALSLGADVILVAPVGDDPAARCLENILNKSGIRLRFYVNSLFKTTTKTRIIARNQQLLRVDEEKACPIKDHKEYDQKIQEAIQECDVVICSDYAKGALANVAEIIRSARAQGKTIIVDPKGKDFTKYAGANLITPNVPELEAIVGACVGEEEIVLRGTDLVKRLGIEGLLVTRSENGMTLIMGDKGFYHQKSHADSVVDVTGAGDTVVAALGVGLASGLPIKIAVQLSNIAAGIVVGKFGSSTVTMDEIVRKGIGPSEDCGPQL